MVKGPAEYHSEEMRRARYHAGEDGDLCMIEEDGKVLFAHGKRTRTLCISDGPNVGRPADTQMLVTLLSFGLDILEYGVNAPRA